MDLGSYIEYDGKPAVRFERTYPHSVERVWSAITHPDELARWFPQGVQVELRAGGTISFTDDPYSDPSTGTVLVCEPPHRLGFTWYADELHFELVSASEGCTLILVNVLDTSDTAARSATGWTVCLTELDKLLDGRPGSGPHGDDVEPFEPIYQRYVDTGMPHGAAIPGRSEGVG